MALALDAGAPNKPKHSGRLDLGSSTPSACTPNLARKPAGGGVTLAGDWARKLLHAGASELCAAAQFGPASDARAAWWREPSSRALRVR